MSRRWVCVFFLSLIPSSILATEIPPVLLPAVPVKSQIPQSLRLAEKSALPPLAVLRSAESGAADQLDAITAWNGSGRIPVRNGFSRPLPEPKTVRFTADLLKSQPSQLAGGSLLAPPSGGLVWGAEVQVASSNRLRLHLSNVALPAGTWMWVYDQDGKEVGFDAATVTQGSEIWTPSVAGPSIRFEVRLPEGAVEGYSFKIDQVLELFALDAKGAPALGIEAAIPGTKQDTSCAQNAACFSTGTLSFMDVFKRASAYLEFIDGGLGYSCSGGLMNDTDSSTTIPYLLTAHHCFSTQASASTLEAFFDYITPTCLGSSQPSLSSLPRVNGATLLATGEATDFTFLRLSNLPVGRGLLGVTNQAVANGTPLYRISFPLGASMGYSVTTMSTSVATCKDAPRSSFLYSVRSLGAIFEGSSGSPVVRSDGLVVGQLTGACGPTAQADEGCDSSNAMVDGAMSGTWASISPWLNPATTNPGSCTATATNLCLGTDGRFKVEATYDTGTQNGQAQAVKLTDDSGYLWFFDATNVEAVVKVLDACGYNSRYWVYAGGLTNVQVVLTVTDTKTGTVKTYTNPQKTAFQPIQDVNAFATCP